MPTYPDTNSIAALNPATPAGTDLPSELDDAIRELKLVTKTVLANHLSDKGAVRLALFKLMISTDIATVANNAWWRIPLATTVDPTSLLGASAYAYSIVPIAGTYLVEFFAHGYSCGTFQSRVGQATGAATNPSASNLIADLVSGGSFSSNASGYGSNHTQGAGLLVADGVKSYCLDFFNTSTGKVALAAVTGCAAAIKFTYLGLVVP